MDSFHFEQCQGYKQFWHYGRQLLKLAGSFRRSGGEDKKLLWRLLGSSIWMPFHQVRLSFPFSNFEVTMINRLRVSPLQLHPWAWAFMKVFQLCAEHKYWKLSLEPFYDLFYAALTFWDKTQIREWSSFSLKPIGSTFSTMTGVTSLNLLCWWKLLLLGVTLPFNLSLGPLGLAHSYNGGFLKYWSLVFCTSVNLFLLTILGWIPSPPRRWRWRRIYVLDNRGSIMKNDLVLTKYPLLS